MSSVCSTLWSVIRTPMPRCRSPATMVWMSCTAIGSTPANGSSSSMNLGRVTSARVISRREAIPARVPYLSADAALVAQWGERLGPRQGLRVGLVWSGNPTHLNDPNRSAPLAEYAGLLGLPCQFVSLHKVLRKADQATLAGQPALLHFGERLADFADTAAVVAQLDLVIAVDTAVAHLAGALGKSTWLLLPHAPDWRWLLERLDSPWYPTMRLFRQRSPGDWQGVLAEAAAALHRLIEA